MVNILNDTPGSPPIREVHIWIGHYADGTEGILAADFPVMDGATIRHMPLMNSRRDAALTFEQIAKNIKSASQHARARIMAIELRTFCTAD